MKQPDSQLRKRGVFIHAKLIKERMLKNPNQRYTKGEAWKEKEEEMPVFEDRNSQKEKWAHCPKLGSLSPHFPS